MLSILPIHRVEPVWVCKQQPVKQHRSIGPGLLSHYVHIRTRLRTRRDRGCNLWLKLEPLCDGRDRPGVGRTLRWPTLLELHSCVFCLLIGRHDGRKQRPSQQPQNPQPPQPSRLNQASKAALHTLVFGQAIGTGVGCGVGALVAAGATAATGRHPLAGATVPAGCVGGGIIGFFDGSPIFDTGRNR